MGFSVLKWGSPVFVVGLLLFSQLLPSYASEVHDSDEQTGRGQRHGVPGVSSNPADDPLPRHALPPPRESRGRDNASGVAPKERHLHQRPTEPIYEVMGSFEGQPPTGAARKNAGGLKKSPQEERRQVGDGGYTSGAQQARNSSEPQNRTSHSDGRDTRSSSRHTTSRGGAEQERIYVNLPTRPPPKARKDMSNAGAPPVPPRKPIETTEAHKPQKEVTYAELRFPLKGQAGPPVPPRQSHGDAVVYTQVRRTGEAIYSKPGGRQVGKPLPRKEPVPRTYRRQPVQNAGGAEAEGRQEAKRGGSSAETSSATHRQANTTEGTRQEAEQVARPKKKGLLSCLFKRNKAKTEKRSAANKASGEPLEEQRNEW